MLLLILSEMSCIMEVNGEDQVVAAEVQNLTPVQMGNIRVSDLMAGLVQGTDDVILTFELTSAVMLDVHFHLLTSQKTTYF